MHVQVMVVCMATSYFYVWLERLSRCRLLSLGGTQGFVDLAIICSFTRMAQALGTQPKGPVSPHAVAQVGVPAGQLE